MDALRESIFDYIIVDTHLQSGLWLMQPLSPSGVIRLSWSQNLVPMDVGCQKAKYQLEQTILFLRDSAQ